MYLMTYFRIMLKSGIPAAELQEFIASKSDKPAFRDQPYWMLFIRQYDSHALNYLHLQCPERADMTERAISNGTAKKSICVVCKTEKNEQAKDLSRCGKCLMVRYCSKECQKIDWKVEDHKSICGCLALYNEYVSTGNYDPEASNESSMPNSPKLTFPITSPIHTSKE